MNRTWQSVLGRFLQHLQLWLLFETWGYVLCRLALVLLPVGALAVAVDQGWFEGAYSLSITLSVLIPLAVIPAGYALFHRGTRLHHAFEMDERAGLKDRISSAWEFLGQDSLTHEQTLQVRDALRTAHDVDLASLITLQNSRLPRWAFVALGVFVASFFMPSVYQVPTVDAAVDTIKMLQLAEVESLKNEVEKLAKEEDLKELVEKLKEVQERFEQGEMNERDVMIALARMDKELQEKMEAMGVEELNAQLNQVVPHLMASTAAQQVAQQIKEDKLDEAAKEMDKLDAKLQKDELTPEEKEQLALNMGAAAAKLGKGEKGTLGSDFNNASQSVKSGNKEGIKSSFKSMKDKMGQCNSLRQMKKLSNCLGTCKGNMGNKASLLAKIGKGENNNKSDSPSTNAGLGSVKAEGEGKGLEDSYREMLNVQGMAGEGPVESEVEVTDGQTSASTLDAKEMYNEYAAVAEQALDQEAIPLSHRFHVKRYFQAIRPEE